MGSFTSSELLARADRLENQIMNPWSTDDLRWLKRWAEKMRRPATQKERSYEHKEAKEDGKEL